MDFIAINRFVFEGLIAFYFYRQIFKNFKIFYFFIKKIIIIIIYCFIIQKSLKIKNEKNIEI